jgi:hypothetical protein
MAASSSMQLAVKLQSDTSILCLEGRGALAELCVLVEHVSHQQRLATSGGRASQLLHLFHSSGGTVVKFLHLFHKESRHVRHASHTQLRIQPKRLLAGKMRVHEVGPR